MVTKRQLKKLLQDGQIYLSFQFGEDCPEEIQEEWQEAIVKIVEELQEDWYNKVLELAD